MLLNAVASLGGLRVRAATNLSTTEIFPGLFFCLPVVHGALCCRQVCYRAIGSRSYDTRRCSKLISPGGTAASQMFAAFP
jgi:hypothetical protein